MNRMPLLAIAAVLLAALPLAGCGPSPEERKILDALNSQPELLERGGRIKTFELREGWGGGRRGEGRRGGDAAPQARAPERPEAARARGGFYGIEAEIVDAYGTPIGRLRSQRVEGFGTMKPRIKWYATPGVPEEW